jgi:hypothetical protein
VSGLTRRTTAGADRVAAWGTRWLQGGLARRLWLVLASAAAVFGLGFGTLQAASVVAHEERTEVAEVDVADVDSVAVDNGAGSVTVIGVEGADTVTVRARVSDGLRATGHEVTTRERVLRVRGSCPLFGSEWCEVDYTIEVPSDMYVDADGRDGVVVSDQAGGLRAHSSEGAIELTRVGGEVTASAGQGRIEGDGLTATRLDASAGQGRVAVAFATSPDHVVAHAGQSRIDIVLPDDPEVFYDTTETDASQGSVNVAVRTDPDSDRSISARAGQSSITIGYGTTTG